MFDSHGGLLEYRAAILASHGFLVLALGFFAYKDPPATLNWKTLSRQCNGWQNMKCLSKWDGIYWSVIWRTYLLQRYEMSSSFINSANVYVAKTSDTSILEASLN